MDITKVTQAIAAAETTSNKWVEQLTNGKTKAILTFSTRKAATEVARQLREAGVTDIEITRTPYKEYILLATWA